MESTVAVLALVRNEANRLWPSALEAWNSFADEIIVLDDGSTDNTIALAEQVGATVYTRFYRGKAAWGAESPARAELFELGCKSSTDWLFILDADMTPARDPRPLMQEPVDAISFRLYDLWSEAPLQYRTDGHWQAHIHPRVWAVRNPGVSFEANWNERGIHCGHLPANGPWRNVVTAPKDYSLLHYAYIRDSWRRDKLEAYQGQYEQMTIPEILHAESIVDALPVLQNLPFRPELTLHV